MLISHFVAHFMQRTVRGALFTRFSSIDPFKLERRVTVAVPSPKPKTRSLRHPRVRLIPGAKSRFFWPERFLSEPVVPPSTIPN
jgi:hypothetical protein